MGVITPTRKINLCLQHVADTVMNIGHLHLQTQAPHNTAPPWNHSITLSPSRDPAERGGWKLDRGTPSNGNAPVQQSQSIVYVGV